MLRKVKGEYWREEFDPEEFSRVETMGCETDDQPTHYSVLGLDGNPIPLPTMKFGFWPSE